jgi:hypothetical protein
MAQPQQVAVAAVVVIMVDPHLTQVAMVAPVL